MNEKTELFESDVAKTICRHHLLSDGEKVLVALSGGADSVALLSVLHHLKYDCVAVHCNFKLRGEESDRDERFVRDLCSQKKVPLYVKAFNTRQYATDKGISIEMAARDLRYAFFDEIRHQESINKVAVAHHRDDNVETLLLNLVRGTGLKGLTGMRYVRDAVIRPLLDVSRKDILVYLAEAGQTYVVDSTNLENEVKRNKIRLDILPELQKLNPSVTEGLQQTLLHLSDAYQIYQWGVEHLQHKVCHDNCIFIDELQQTPAPRTLLYEILSDYGFMPSQVEEINGLVDNDTSSGQVFESSEWRLLHDRRRLVLQKKSEHYQCLCSVLPLDGWVKVTPDKDMHISRVRYDKNFEIPRRKDVLCIDLNKITYPLTIRFTKPGDRFVPFGMKGSKLVSDYLTDLKKSVFEKERQLVLCSGQEIAWLVGERPDDRFRVDDQTERVLMIQLLKS